MSTHTDLAGSTTSDGVPITDGLTVLTTDFELVTVSFDDTAQRFEPGAQVFDGWFSTVRISDGHRGLFDGSRLTTRIPATRL